MTSGSLIGDPDVHRHAGPDRTGRRKARFDQENELLALVERVDHGRRELRFARNEADGGGQWLFAAGPVAAHMHARANRKLRQHGFRREEAHLHVRGGEQSGDWLAGGKFALSIFGPISRMDLDVMQVQGLPVSWFAPDHLKEGAYITAGSGGVALINKAPQPNAAKVGLNWLLSREGQIAYQRIFTEGNDGPDSLRIDIPKDKVPRGNRRPQGGENLYPFVDRAEWMDMEPVNAIIGQALADPKKK